MHIVNLPVSDIKYIQYCGIILDKQSYIYSNVLLGECLKLQ